MKYTVGYHPFGSDPVEEVYYNLTIATARLMAKGVGAFNIVSEYDDRGRLLGMEKWFVGARAPYVTMTITQEDES
jgi:hypothetical protein